MSDVLSFIWSAFTGDFLAKFESRLEDDCTDLAIESMQELTETIKSRVAEEQSKAADTDSKIDIDS